MGNRSKATRVKEGRERPTLHLPSFSFLPSSISYNHMIPSQHPRGSQKHNLGSPGIAVPLVSSIGPLKKKKRQSFMHNPVSLSRQETDMFILWQLRYLCFAQCLGAGVLKTDKSVCKFDFCWWWSFSWLTWQIFSNGFQIKRTGTTVLKSSSTDVGNMRHVGTLSKYGGWGGNLSTLRKNTDSLQHIPSG